MNSQISIHKNHLALFVFLLCFFLPVMALSLPYQQDPGPDGIVSIEVENFDTNMSQGGHDWVQVFPAGHSGLGAMEASPNIGTNNNTGYEANSPRLDFEVNFVHTGIHYVWIRGIGASGNDDSVHVGLDGVGLLSSDRISEFSTSWTWSRDTMDLVVATVDVATSGVHTVNVWMREDGFVIDKIVLTTSAIYIPSGEGPVESPRANSLVFNPDVMAFTVEEGGSTPSQTTDLDTSDSSIADYTVSDDAAWLTFVPSSGQTPATLTVSINATGLSPGTYTATITGTASGYSDDTVDVTLTVTSANSLVFNPDVMAFTVEEGGSTPSQTTDLDTSDSSIADYTVSDDAAWLTVVPSSGQTPATLTVSIDATGLSPGTYTATITGTASGYSDDTVDVTLTVTSSNYPYQQDTGPDGIVSIEVENFDTNMSQGGHDWVDVFPAGHSGPGSMEASPNIGTNNNTGYESNSPRLDFEVNFVHTGIHYVWIRGIGASGNDDSVHVGLDGVGLLSSDRISEFSTSWTWSRDTMDLVVATVDVATSGVHTVNVWMREDGFVIDKIVLTTSAIYIPSGEGPVESPRANSLVFNPDVMAFTVEEGGSTSSQTTDLDTSDSSIADYTVSDDAAWLTVVPSSGQTPATLTVSIDATGLSPGTYTATITGTASDYSDDTVDVTLTVTSANSLVFNPDVMAFTVEEGGSTPSQTTDLDTSDSSIADYTVSDDAAWLTVVPSSGQTPATLTVSIDATGLSPGTYTATITGTASGYSDDTVDVTLTVTSSNYPYQQDTGPDGIVSIEVENFDTNMSQGGHDWVDVFPAGHSGPGSMEASPNIGTNNNTGYESNSPRLDFEVNFVHTGIHYVWIRGIGASGNDDSVHVGLDGVGLLSSDRISEFSTSWTWSRDTMDLVVATVDVATSGVHTVNVWMREDGFVIDKIVLTTSAIYIPSGEGPVESPRANSLVFNPDVMAFTVEEGGSTSSQTTDLDTSDSSIADYTVSDDAAWLTVVPSSGQTPATLTVSIDATGLSPGTYTATITGTASDYSDDTVDVTLTVTSANSLVFNPDVMAFTVEEGGSTPSQTTDLDTSDSSIADYTVSDDAAWLTVVPSSGQTPATLTVSIDATGLSPGTYTATITGTASGYSDDTVDVTLTVTGTGSVYDLLSGSFPDRSNPVSLEGESVSGNIYVFTSPDEGVSRVSFYLDDPGMNGNPCQVENYAPYDFAGTAGSGIANPFNTNNLSDGSHEITALIELTAGGTEVVSSTFTVVNQLSLPFLDDFNDGYADGWVVFNDSEKEYNWEVINKEYCQTAPFAGSTFIQSYHIGKYSFFNHGLGLSNYRFSVELKPLSELGNDIGVMFRYQDNDNYYRLSLNSRYGFTRLEKKVDGNFIPLMTNSRGFQNGQYMNIAIELNGSLIQIYLNGDPLFGLMDESLNSGTVALYCQGMTKFDNVLIEQNCEVPSVVISAPLSYSVDDTDSLNVTAVVSNTPGGGWVEFILDDSSSVPDFDYPFAAQFLNLDQGDHKVEASLYDSEPSPLAVDVNEKTGSLGTYFVSVGDSITNGSCDNYSFDNISQSGRIFSIQGYEANLVDMLDSTVLYPTIVFNEGIPGDESCDAAYKRIESILFRHPGSNKILILLGTNDSGGSLPVLSGLECSGASCAGTFKENMQLLIGEVIGYGKLPVVGSVPPTFQKSTFPNPLNSERNLLIQEYNSVITSELTGCDVGPDFFSFFLSPTYNRFSLFADSLHPNALGHAVMAYLWHNTLTGGELEPFILQDLEPSTIDPYLKQNLLEVGNTYYVDEEYTLTNIPPELNGGIWIMTANSERFNMESDYLSFSVDRNVEVYVGYDHGATTPPNWLQDNFESTGEVIGVTDPGTSVLNLYKAAFASGGPITLGGNMAQGAAGASSSYVVIVVEN